MMTIEASAAGDFNMEYRLVDITSSVITIPEELRQWQESQAAAQASMYQPGAVIETLYPPILLEAAELSEYELLGRHWAFIRLITLKSTVIPAMIVKDASLKEPIRAWDKEEFIITSKLLINLAKKARKHSRTTRDRMCNKAAGRVCPFCHGIIRQPRCIGDRLRAGGHIVMCENAVKNPRSKRYNTGCNFVMSLTGYEIELFKEHRLDISSILVWTNKKCPQCQSPLLRRTIYHSAEDRRIQLRCERGYSRINRCDHAER